MGDFIPQTPSLGTGAGRAQWAQKPGGVGNRKERHLWRDDASSPVQSPAPLFASRL